MDHHYRPASPHYQLLPYNRDNATSLHNRMQDGKLIAVDRDTPSTVSFYPGVLDTRTHQCNPTG